MNNHASDDQLRKVRRYRCACGCGKIAFLFRMVPVQDGTATLAVIREHVEGFANVLRNRDELREFLHNHSKGWFHRVRWAPMLRRLHLHAHQNPRLTRQAVLMFLSPRWLANWIASR